MSHSLRVCLENKGINKSYNISRRKREREEREGELVANEIHSKILKKRRQAGWAERSKIQKYPHTLMSSEITD